MRITRTAIALLLCCLTPLGCKGQNQAPPEVILPPTLTPLPPVNPAGTGLTIAGATPAATVSASGSYTHPAPAWPRTYLKDGNTVVMYQPQVDSWKDHSKLRFRAAVVVTPILTGKTDYGVVAVQADTLVDDAARTVFMTNMDVAVRFPGMEDAQALPLKAMVKECLPSMNYMDISLDQVLACIHEEPKLAKVEVNLNPPPMYYSDVPAIMVIYIGQPQFKPIKDTQLMFAINTNWVVLMDTKTAQYYLLDGESWLTSPDPVKGPWTAAKELPAEVTSQVEKLPTDGNWEEVRKNIPGKPFKVIPKVFASTEPAELIVTSGPPVYSPIVGTRLMYVSNPTMPLFWDLIDENYYYLVAGRWFRTKQLTGPWTAASTNLPLEFCKIPADGPLGYVLASIPNTQEARDAILLASIPHKATINIKDAKVNVVYEGEPKFVAIEGTPMTYAVNSPYQVVFASGQYYCCYNGVWFLSPIATGPWVVCTSVPAVIYTMPVTCPLYNCTYVQVYGYTPTTVVVGYTSGYSGEYVAATGALMFGAGMMVGAAMSSSCYSSCYYSYGCCAHYSYYNGCYHSGGGSYYGPHGSASWGSSYNPSTGTWARSGSASGAGGEVHGSQAYNPFTNTYGQHTGGSNGYQSWGHSYVQQGNKWAESGHQSVGKGQVGYAQNSSGQWAEGARGANGNSVAKTSNGDYYASHDGNVYKQSDGQWQKYQGNGNWSDTSYNKSDAQQSADTARTNTQNSAAANSWKSGADDNQWKNNWENKSSESSNSWAQHDTQSSLNSDAWSRNQGSSNAASSWGGDHSGGGGWGGEDHSAGGWGGGGGGWGGGGGGRFGGFRR